MAEKGGLGGAQPPEPHIMPKHKRDKHAKSIAQGKDHQQTGVPPTEGGSTSNVQDPKAFQQQDATRRLGGYEGAGEHARTGNRGHQ